MKGHALFQEELITKELKYIGEILKIFSRTTGPSSTKLGTKHCLGEGDSCLLNEWPHPFPRGENYEIIVKIH